MRQTREPPAMVVSVRQDGIVQIELALPVAQELAAFLYWESDGHMGVDALSALLDEALKIERER
jgi:hypothetical protein